MWHKMHKYSLFAYYMAHSDVHILEKNVGYTMQYWKNSDIMIDISYNYVTI